MKMCCNNQSTDKQFLKYTPVKLIKVFSLKTVHCTTFLKTVQTSTEMKSTVLFTIFFLSVSSISGDILPASYDWRDYIRLSPVGDQGNCTAFYAFTTAALTEAAHAIYYNQQDFVLSKQQLVDCTNRANNPITPNYNFGCAGGSIGPAFQYLISHGVVEEKYYPYVDNVSNFFQ